MMLPEQCLTRHDARLQYKIGPDPSSIDSCMVGGMVSNNSSGMCCGVAQNTYHTLKDMRVVLADGSVLDTSDAASRQAFLEVLARPALLSVCIRFHNLVDIGGPGASRGMTAKSCQIANFRSRQPLFFLAEGAVFLTLRRLNCKGLLLNLMQAHLPGYQCLAATCAEPQGSGGRRRGAGEADTVRH